MEKEDQMKRVCIITTVHNALDTRIYYKEIRSLSKNYMVEYCAPISNIQQMPKLDRVIIKPLNSAKSKLGRIRTHFDLVRLIIKSNCSLYHLQDPELIPLGVVLKYFNKKVIFDMHENVLLDIKTKNYISPYIRKFIFILFSIIYKISRKKFDFFILAEDSYRKIMNNRNYKTIFNYPILKKIEPPQKKKFKYGMVYVGSITRDRGVWNMLRSFQIVQESIPESSLHLIGPIDEPALESEIKMWIAEHSLADKVCLYGRVPNERIFDIVKHNSIGLCLLDPLIGFQESLPTKMFEYMLSSLPVVISDFKLWKQIVDDSGCGVALNPQNHIKVAEEIIKLFKDEVKMEELGKNGLNAVRSLYSWEQEEKKLLNIYKQIIGH